MIECYPIGTESEGGRQLTLCFEIDPEHETVARRSTRSLRAMARSALWWQRSRLAGKNRAAETPWSWSAQL